MMVDPTGATLHPYQRYAVDFIKSRPYCGLFLDMGLGKAMDDDTVVPTPDGKRRLGDLRVGDVLYDRFGRETSILAVYKHPAKTAYQVTLDDGRSFVCCNEHLVPVLANGVFRDITPVPLQAILDDWAKSELTPHGYRRVYSIPGNALVPHVDRSHAMRPYDLGVVLRCGSVVDGRFRLVPVSEVPMDDALVIHAYKELERSYGILVDAVDFLRFNGQDSNLRLLADLARLGYGPEGPFDGIPLEYLEDGAVNRCDLLMGYFLIDRDNDPMSQLRQHVAVPHQGVAEGLADVIRSLGFYCKLKYRPKLKVWDLSAELKQRGSYDIVDVKKVPDRDMTCFTVDSQDHTFLANDYIVTHNTRTTLQAIYEQNPRHHVLVVAPKNIARSTWLQEINKWGYPLRTESLICNEQFRDLSRKARLEKYDAILSTPPTMYFINRELFCDLVKHMPVVAGKPTWPFPSVILDESQSFKNYKAERFKALKYVRPAISQLIELTGTPTPNGLMDLWPQMFLLDQGARLGPNISWYRRVFFQETFRVNGYPVGWRPLPGAEEEIFRRIDDVVISMHNTLPLPPVTYDSFPVFLDEDEMAAYKQLAKDAVFTIDDDRQVTAANAAVLKNKLCQMASGTLYTEEGSKEYLVIHRKKLEACRYIIDNSSDGVLIAYHFQSDLDQLLGYLPEAVRFDGSPKMQDDWNAGKIKVLLVQPSSAGHGLNLQDGGHTIIWYTIYPNLEEYLQTNARLARQGQTKPVVIHHLLTQQTVDPGFMAMLNDKDMSERRLLEAVQVVLDEN